MRLLHSLAGTSTLRGMTYIYTALGMGSCEHISNFSLCARSWPGCRYRLPSSRRTPECRGEIEVMDSLCFLPVFISCENESGNISTFDVFTFARMSSRESSLRAATMTPESLRPPLRLSSINITSAYIDRCPNTIMRLPLLQGTFTSSLWDPVD